MAVGGLKQEFQIDDDEAKQVVGTALKMGYGPQAFPMIYQAMAYQKVRANKRPPSRFRSNRERQRNSAKPPLRRRQRW